MREIKFRGQCKISKDFVIGDLIHGVGNKSGRMFILPINKNLAYVKYCDPLDGVEVIPETIGQFTGLIDKNEVEVYKGDIIEWKETRFHTEEQEAKGVPMPKVFKSVVVFEEGSFMVSAKDENDTFLSCFFSDCLSNKFDYKAKVIGNIYQNPELL